jgi:hypothetical protein
MTKDFIGYRALTDAALRGVVREALKRAEKQGLIGAHHFRLTFRTHYPGVEIPDFLREQYLEEMTPSLIRAYSSGCSSRQTKLKASTSRIRPRRRRRRRCRKKARAARNQRRRKNLLPPAKW